MDAIRQHVRVTFSFPVCFTTGVFEADNRLLRDLISDTDDPAPADIVVVVDDGVANAHPALLGRIAHYCQAHADAIRLARERAAQQEQVRQDRAFESAVAERHAAESARADEVHRRRLDEMERQQRHARGGE